MSFYSLEAKTLQGKPFVFDSLKNKVVLIVNVASKCGYTKQYAGLQALYDKYKDQGLVILGCPCNQFGKQEPGSPEEIAQFCSATYGVNFPLLAKADVNGPETSGLYQFLKAEKPGDIAWNFEVPFSNDRNH
jgi:glutathione peroxidase